VTFSLPDLSKQSLRSRGISPAFDELVEFVVACLHEACALVSEDTGDDRHDDRISKGFLRWRRPRNLIIERIAEEGPRGARAIDVENALQLLFENYRLSFYSAPNGVEHPDLSGASKTKRGLVDEMQLVLDGTDNGSTSMPLALLYEADYLGLRSAAVGVLESTHDWHWRVTAFRRDGVDEVPVGGDGGKPKPRHPTYDEQPVTELPPLRPKEKRDEDSGADQS
jgi:hypothetical protein